MNQPRFDESLWFDHMDGTRLYPWWRHATKRARTAFWVSDGSNLIEDADPVESIEALVHEVFGRSRSVWLRSKQTPAITGLYRLGAQAIRRWGATASVKPLVASDIGQAGSAVHKASPGLSRDTSQVSAAALAATLMADMANLGATEREALVRHA